MVAHTLARFPLAPRLHLAVTVIACLAACGGGEETGTPGPAPTETATTPDAGAPAGAPQGRRAGATPVTTTSVEPSGSDELGGLHGTILFSGTAPERFPLGAKQVAECQHHTDVDQRSNVVVVNDGKLANVFVTLKSGYDEAQVPTASTATVTLDQRGCMYVPRALGLQLGQKLLVANSDPTNHNVHTKPRRNAEVNRSMGARQPALEFTFEHAEMVPFACDIHPWMGAAVFVEEHPWFAVTDENGAFRIANVPPGEYVVEARHEHKDIRAVTGTVTVKAGESQGFTLTLALAK
jgi:plastocyanin